MTATANFPKHRPGHADLGLAPAHSDRAIRPSCGSDAETPIDAGRLPPGPDSTPHVLHIDPDPATALALEILLTPEARVTHVTTLAGAHEALRRQIFSAVVIDHHLPDGDAADLLPALAAIPLLVYSASEPAWCSQAGAYLPKPWTAPRRLWSTIAGMLGISTPSFAGD